MFFIVMLQERGTATEPPPRATFSGNVTQWEIFDAYQEDFEKQVSGFKPRKLLWFYYFFFIFFLFFATVDQNQSCEFHTTVQLIWMADMDGGWYKMVVNVCKYML